MNAATELAIAIKATPAAALNPPSGDLRYRVAHAAVPRMTTARNGATRQNRAGSERIATATEMSGPDRPSAHVTQGPSRDGLGRPVTEVGTDGVQTLTRTQEYSSRVIDPTRPSQVNSMVGCGPGANTPKLAREAMGTPAGSRRQRIRSLDSPRVRLRPPSPGWHFSRCRSSAESLAHGDDLGPLPVVQSRRIGPWVGPGGLDCRPTPASLWQDVRPWAAWSK